jgi:hypothetical protein
MNVLRKLVCFASATILVGLGAAEAQQHKNPAHWLRFRHRQRYGPGTLCRSTPTGTEPPRMLTKS